MYFMKKGVVDLTIAQKMIFITVCSERVVPVFEFNYDETIRDPREAIFEIRQMLLAKKINRSALDSLRNRVHRVIPNIDKMGSEFSPSMLAGVAILYAIDFIGSGETDKAFKSLEYSLESVDAFSEFNGRGLEEEKYFHRKAFEIVRKFDFFPVSEIDNLKKSPPEWSSNWRD